MASTVAAPTFVSGTVEVDEPDDDDDGFVEEAVVSGDEV